MQDSRLERETQITDFLTPFGVRVGSPTFQSNRTYVIVEPMLEPNIRKILAQQNVFDVLITKIFKKTVYDDLADKGPIIALIPSKNDAFTELMTAFQITPSGCFIQSSLPFKEMVEWARQRLTVHKENVPALLRFYEPRTLLPLLSGFEADTKTAFLNGITSLHWFDQQWLSQDNDNIDSSATMQWALTREHLNIASTTQKTWIELNDRHA